MLAINKITEKYFSVKFNYYKKYVQTIKKIPGATFVKKQKHWIVPMQYIKLFDSLFKGQIVYQTPKWILFNEQRPDYTKLYKIDGNIKTPIMRKSPFKFQDYGIRFMIDRIKKYGFVLNSDACGLGKTIMSIGTFLWLINNKQCNKIIIACRKSARKQWIDEIKNFADLKDFHYEIIGGTKAQRKKIYENIKNSNKVIITITYETMMNDYDVLSSIGFDLAIYDECHIIKAYNGKKHNVAKKIANKCKYIILLTGTPIMNRPIDIYGVLDVANSKYINMNKKDFENKYVVYDFNGRYKRFVGIKNLDDLRNKVQSIIIRRTDKEVNIDLPKVLYKKIIINKDKIQKKIIEALDNNKSKILTQLDSLRELYAKSKNNIKKEKIKNKGIILDKILKGHIACYQAIANDPRLFKISKSKNIINKYASLIPNSYKMSNKTEALLDLIEDIVNSNEKVIVFSKFERSTAIIKDDICKCLKYNTLLYTGKQNDNERNTAIDMFKNSSDYNILIATEAASESLNLQCARHIINYDQPDTFAIKNQRIGRIKRASSNYKSVICYDLITTDTVDEKNLNKLNQQSNLQTGIVDLDNTQKQFVKELSN